LDTVLAATHDCDNLVARVPEHEKSRCLEQKQDALCVHVQLAWLKQGSLLVRAVRIEVPIVAVIPKEAVRVWGKLFGEAADSGQ
jgi:hypothetical protein